MSDRNCLNELARLGNLVPAAAARQPERRARKCTQMQGFSNRAAHAKRPKTCQIKDCRCCSLAKGPKGLHSRCRDPISPLS